MSVFNGLEYIASYADLMAAFGANKAAGELHYNNVGRLEGRVVTFDGLEYIASYADLSAAFGPNEDAGAAHFIQSGRFEGRTVTFDGLDYIASYADLRAALGANSDAGSIHFITNGRAENRAVTFDGLEYVASYNDLASAFGPNAEAGAAHFIARGAAEGRDGDSFSAWHYLHNYTDLLNAFGNNVEAATNHYITNCRFEGRTDAAVDAWGGVGGLRIMALGDSITRGSDSPTTGGYRGPLDQLFNSAGQNVDFVGALGAGTGGNIPDPQHEGVSGRTALELISQVTSIVNANHPDAVLLMIGTNDIINLGASADVTVSRIVSVVNNIHAVDSSIHVLVAGLLPTSQPEGGQIAPANAGLIRAIDSLEAQGRAVSFVDTSAITLADLSDGVHPSAAGHAELAGIWFDAIQDEVPHPSGDFLF